MMEYQLEWLRLRRGDKIRETMHDVIEEGRTMEKRLKAQTSGGVSVMLTVLGMLRDVL